MSERERPRRQVTPAAGERPRPPIEPLAPPAPPEAPASHDRRLVAGRYELVETLARGNFAVTHRARDLTTGRECVVKEVLYRRIEDPKVLELLEREARVLSELRHPRVPRFVEFFTERDGPETRLYLVQEYVRGRSLADLVRRGKHFTEREAIGIGLQVARVLAHLHELRPPIIHRDVKPGNVVLADDGAAWLIDFGAVRDRILHEVRTEGGEATIVGTYGYMPFEQFQGRALPASDVYALGMTLVFLLSHKEPHEIESVSGTFELEPHLRVSPGLLQVLRKMTARDPEDRYADAAEACAALEAVLATPQPGKRERRAAAVKDVAESVATSGPAVWLRRHLGALAVAVAVSGFIFSSLWMRPSSELARRPLSAPVAAVQTRQSGTPQVQGVTYTMTGRLTVGGRPLESVTGARPRFSIQHIGRGGVRPAVATYEGGRFVIRGVPEGWAGIGVDVDANARNPARYPGDLYAWKTFNVSGQTTTLDLDLWPIIRLRAPEDSETMGGAAASCAQLPGTPGPALIAWDAVAPGMSYEYDVQRVSCGSGSRALVLKGSTQDSAVQLPLPASSADEYYALRLYGRQDGRTGAVMITHGGQGVSSDYRFRVE